MTDKPEDLTQPEEAESSAEPAVDESLDAWGDSTTEPTWTPIEVEGEASGAGPAGPAPDTIEATAEEDEPEPVEPETKPADTRQPASTGSPYSSVAQQTPAPSGGRRRRPTSLRDEEHVANIPRRPLSPPDFKPASGQHSPASAAAGAESTPAKTESGPASLPAKLFALTSERPELGLGVAFLGGLVIATILKRLGRR